MPGTILNVFFEHHHVGTLTSSHSDKYFFKYSTQWLHNDVRFPISLNLPLREEEFSQQESRSFFSNLLPEGTVRTLVTRRFGISEDNDFTLLKAIGGECAGALTIQSGFLDKAAKGSYRKLTADELRKLSDEQSPMSLFNDEDHVRLSLAGAQDKLPIRWRKGKVTLPLGGAASSHILKFSNARFSHLPANEVFVTMLAKAVGINAVEAAILKGFVPSSLCLVRRYDRINAADGSIKRLHQEDFCQALGLSSTQKYEAEQGPGFPRCFTVVEQFSSEPLLDTRRLIDWHIFNSVVGNADGHAKNLSLLRQPDGTLRLAPFYDLVCTYAYDRISKNMAMSTAGCNVPGKLTKKHWNSLAGEVSVGTGYLRSRVTQLSESILDELPSAKNIFIDKFGDDPALQMVIVKIRKLARAVGRSVTL